MTAELFLFTGLFLVAAGFLLVLHSYRHRD